VLLARRPAAGEGQQALAAADVLARKVHHRVQALQPAQVDAALGGVPPDLVGRGRRVAHQPKDLRVERVGSGGAAQARGERAPHHAGRAGDGDAEAHGSINALAM
jgi:hypothetical protein